MEFDTFMTILVYATGALIVIGLLIGRKLSPKAKEVHRQKVFLIGLAVVAFALPFVEPYVSSMSLVDDADKSRIVSVVSTEDLIRSDKDQRRQIDELKREVIRLRKEVHYANDYYGAITKYTCLGIGIFALTAVFPKRKDENLEEIQPDRISKL